MIRELPIPSGLRYQAPILDYPFCSSCDTCTRRSRHDTSRTTRSLQALPRQLQSTFRAPPEHFQSTSRALSEHLPSTFRAHSEHIQSTFRALSDHLQIDSWKSQYFSRRMTNFKLARKCNFKHWQHSKSTERALTDLSQSTRSIQRALTDLSQLTHRPFTEQKSWTTCGFMIFPRLSPDLPRKRL